MKEIFESFLFMFFAELFLTFYVISSAKGQAIKGSTFASLNTALYCLNIQNVIINYWCIFASMIGAFLGTYLSTHLTKPK